MKEVKDSAMLKALQGLSDDMAGEIGSKSEELQKVSVLAKDKEGLQEGLDQAEEVVSDIPDMSEMTPEGEYEDEMVMDYDSMSLEELLEAQVKLEEAIDQKQV